MISPEIRYVLSLLPVASLSLTLLLVLAFTMVAQSQVADTFRHIENEILNVVSEAAKQVSEKKQVFIVDKRTDSKAKTVTAPKLDGSES